MMAEEAGRLRGGLRSGLRVLREQHRGWRDTLAACLPLLRALGNVGRQAEAARRVSFEETPLRALAGLPERLRLKQRAAMEALLEELRREKLPALREARDAVGACLVPLLALGGPDPQPRAPSPAWADLAAGLLDAEALYHAVYLEARLLLLSLSYRDVAGLQAAPEAWERIMQHGQRGDRVEETLLKAAFFLEDRYWRRFLRNGRDGSLRRAHFPQYLIQPFQSSMKTDLHPTWGAGDRLAMVSCSPALQKRPTNGKGNQVQNKLPLQS
ncbi:AFG2-interacting ribosome maturation factor-like isoform X2 [Ahaetulla prasina]|uniref:AFG2-interacting ribosome maturation factor-like isoform X2 n=1 Tax=Ahaetulla prasina TaxID=499056 RepID=UPI0026484073|nr:AFG2-interacting ribosome maturation factor-like isoform X2 [Ahaetulla prasina]XP_058051107.1 AFG2-interacting ribosome maturation factor-like isoform X2 [Ahaetulla prasina]